MMIIIITAVVNKKIDGFATWSAREEIVETPIYTYTFDGSLSRDGVYRIYSIKRIEMS